MWRIVAYILLLTFVVLVVSQMLLPVFSKTLQPFWLFRRKVTDQSAEQSIEQASAASVVKPKHVAKGEEVKSEKAEPKLLARDEEVKSEKAEPKLLARDEETKSEKAEIDITNCK